MKWFLTVFLILGIVVQILMVGKPREPITPGVAAFTAVANLAIVAGIWTWM